MSHREQSPLQLKFYNVIFGTETPAGKWFDISLIESYPSSVVWGEIRWQVLGSL